MAEEIYILKNNGQLDPMREEKFDSEDSLQKLVADHPELLSGQQVNPDNPRRWLLIDREQGIADIMGGGNRWALDHLLIDQDAIPTLVEAKRSENSEIRRSIVGQMLDYAAHARHTWNVGDIRRAFEKRIAELGQDPSNELAKLLRTDEEPDADEFWQQVETNLRAARLRLLFVADGIPDELTRVVEFLNEQMPGIEVLAVEIKQFLGDTDQTLVPRVVGRSAAAPARSPRSQQGPSLTEQTLVESFEDQKVQLAVRRLLDVAHKHQGVNLSRTTRSVTIRKRCAAWDTYVTVAWLFAPSATGWGDKEGFQFGAGNNYAGFFESLPQNLREVLENWVKEFARDEFAEYFSLTGIMGYAISHEDAAANIDVIAGRLDKVLTDLDTLELVEGS